MEASSYLQVVAADLVRRASGGGQALRPASPGESASSNGHRLPENVDALATLIGRWSGRAADEMEAC